jgi:hypothetical protein
VNEDDPRYWGFASKEELAAHVRKKEQRKDLLKAARASSDEAPTSLQKRSISSRVSRTLDIVADRIDRELDECWEFFLSVAHTAFK